MRKDKRSIFDHLRDNVEGQGKGIHMVVKSPPSSLIQFSAPKQIYFLVVIASSLERVKQKESFVDAIALWRSGKGLNKKGSFSKSMAMWPLFGGLLFDHDKHESPAKSSVISNELEKALFPSTLGS